MVPEIRIEKVNSAPINREGRFVLYWMIASRRTSWNFALERAVDLARELEKPLVILEALRCDYKWASDRLHRFILDGMAEKDAQLKQANVLYYPYFEQKRGQGRGLLAALAEHACVIVTDDFPCFFLPRMVASAGKQVKIRLEKVDSNGLLPLRKTDPLFSRAYDFRRFLQKNLPEHLAHFPKAHPLAGFPIPRMTSLPEDIEKRWPRPHAQWPAGDRADLRHLPIDHSVKIAPVTGGSAAAEETLDIFLNRKLHLYAGERNQPEKDATSGLSPYLHFGHISVHAIFSKLTEREGWNLSKLSDDTSGKRSGWWGMNQSAEAFLDQVVTWRELGYNMCWQREDYDQYESLPDWARRTLAEHQGDKRDFIYSAGEFESGATHDPLWNAAQMQLVREGQMHNYLRMLWGKKILEWSRTPEAALEIMIELNNKYALDGRNPNSYSGVFWVLGRYDRPWGPERPIFGKVRYMSSENTARKFQVKEYIKRHAP